MLTFALFLGVIVDSFGVRMLVEESVGGWNIE
jgi:hypothetical protein